MARVLLEHKIALSRKWHNNSEKLVTNCSVKGWNNREKSTTNCSIKGHVIIEQTTNDQP